MTTVGDAITKFLEEERLTGDEQWRCPQCKAKVDARKRIDLWKLPHVLVLHLKRFEFDMRAMNFRKLSAELKLPLQFDLSPYVSSKQRESAVYDVVAVANHHGAFGSGHYTANCLVRDPQKEDDRGNWYCFDDGRVSSLSTKRGDKIISKDAYVIFLERRGEDRSTLIRKQSVSRPQDWPHMVSRHNSTVKRMLPMMQPMPSQTTIDTKVKSLDAELQARAWATTPSVGTWAQPRLDVLDQLPGIDALDMQAAQAPAASPKGRPSSASVAPHGSESSPSAAASALKRVPSQPEATKAASHMSRVSDLGNIVSKKRTANSLRPEDAISVRHDADGAGSAEVTPLSLMAGSVDSLRDHGEGDVSDDEAGAENVEVDQDLVTSFVSAGLDRRSVHMAVRRSRNDPHQAAAILALTADD